MYDGAMGRELPDDLLAFCTEADPPVAFTFGTGMMHARHLYHDCVDACRLLGIRGVFVTRYASQLPDPMPPFARHVRFAPYRQLFGRCAAVVYHGGVGTLAEAFAAGTPQLVLPISWDQFDNARRVEELGAGGWLKPRRRSAGEIARALSGLLTGKTRQTSREIGHGFGPTRALDDAADLLESLVSGAPTGIRPHSARAAQPRCQT
jgi:UDP:flavonoid glycosyltransferase YjiC (YdhE family)